MFHGAHMVILLAGMVIPVLQIAIQYVRFQAARLLKVLCYHVHIQGSHSLGSLALFLSSMMAKDTPIVLM